MAMHEIRALIAESTMNIYIKGEDIELEQNCIGILLEGFLKTNNQNLITPPGVLLPSNTDLNFFGLHSSDNVIPKEHCQCPETSRRNGGLLRDARGPDVGLVFLDRESPAGGWENRERAMNHTDYCYTAPSYQVEARARVIFFEIGVPETEADLQISVSLLPQTLQSRTLSVEHRGLLSWPESFRKSRGPQNASITEIRNQPAGFSARALQLSMYGNMISGTYPVPVTAAAAGSLRKAIEEGDNSSDESAEEEVIVRVDESAGEEVIVRVDSPSMLSFRQSSGAVDSPQGN